MSGLELSLLAFALLLLAIFLRMPIAAAMAITGFVGSWIVLGRPSAILSQMKSLTYDTFSSYSLSIVPLFLLMGQFALAQVLVQCVARLWPLPAPWDNWRCQRCANGVTRIPCQRVFWQPVAHWEFSSHPRLFWLSTPL